MNNNLIRFLLFLRAYDWRTWMHSSHDSGKEPGMCTAEGTFQKTALGMSPKTIQGTTRLTTVRMCNWSSGGQVTVFNCSILASLKKKTVLQIVMCSPHPLPFFFF